MTACIPSIQNRHTFCTSPKAGHSWPQPSRRPCLSPTSHALRPTPVRTARSYRIWRIADVSKWVSLPPFSHGVWPALR